MFDIYLGANTNHAPVHDVGNGTAFPGDQLILGDNTDQCAGLIHHRESSQAMVGQQPRRLLNRAVFKHSDNVAGHDLFDFHSGSTPAVGFACKTQYHINHRCQARGYHL